MLAFPNNDQLLPTADYEIAIANAERAAAAKASWGKVLDGAQMKPAAPGRGAAAAAPGKAPPPTAAHWSAR